MYRHFVILDRFSLPAYTEANIHRRNCYGLLQSTGNNVSVPNPIQLIIYGEPDESD